ncbi:unnamed protein product [Owenia fusiformis]|uniref:Uncharacterized protein n=1 Tax=Owenia fusiformis TaxID=6347 RepID=A0A8J1TRK4_OWEFU|nr:unnamed protein product [Owenia fusiformis]
MLSIGRLWRAISRKKTIDPHRLQDTSLERCLSVVDLVSIGVGSSLGVGVYVLIPQIAREHAGPSVMLSFLFSAATSVLAGFCYSELAARVPRAGSSYIFCYVSVGELWSFVIGWNMILENVIGAAAVAKAWTQYFDSMLNDTIKVSLEEHAGLVAGPGMSSYPDFISMLLLLFMTILIASGSRISSIMSFVFTVLNILVIMCIVCVGIFHADRANWSASPGFFSHGFHGVVSGTALCFYAYVGVDTIATSGEEARRPTRSIPCGISISLLICFIAFFSVAAVITLMVPSSSIPLEAALPRIFGKMSVTGAQYVIAIGGLCGLTASIIGALYPLPRLIFAMARDGLIFKFLSYVSDTSKSPILAAMVSSSLSALLATLLNLPTLVELMAIGTLMAYAMTAGCVLVLRYQPEHMGLSREHQHQNIGIIHEDSTLSANTISHIQRQLSENTGLLNTPTASIKAKYNPDNNTSETTLYKRIQPQDEGEISKYGSTPDNSSSIISSKERSNSDTDTSKKHQEYPSEYKAMEIHSNNYNVDEIQCESIDEQEEAPQGSTYQRIGSSFSVSSFGSIFNTGDDYCSEATDHSKRISLAIILLILTIWIGICVVAIAGQDHTGTWWAVLLFCTLGVIIICLMSILIRQPVNKTKLIFKVPFVPFLPLTCLFLSVFFMLSLSASTWLRFGVWMFLGFVMYFGYGIRHSKEAAIDNPEIILYDVSDKQSIISNNDVAK